MWTHFVNLLGHSWDAMVRATGTTTLGFIIWTLALTGVGWAATVAARWIELKREKTTSPFEKALLGSRLPGIFLAAGVFGLVFVAFSVFLVRTAYCDHQSLVAENKKLTDRNVTLSADLDWRKHNISTTDAVFPNIIYLLQHPDTELENWATVLAKAILSGGDVIQITQGDPFMYPL